VSAKSLYEILQVHPEASPEVIKAAYKSLSTKYHPDKDKSADAAQRFAEIQNAFNILSEPDRRRQYDANLARGLDSTEATSGSSVVFRVDGSSTFLTLDEHHRRGWQESAACDLSNHDFSGVSFKGAKLAKAKLDGSRFNGCDFRGADLTDCSAKDCQFNKADFAGAKLISTDFSNSKIRAAKLFGLGPVWQSECKSEADRFGISDYEKTLVSNDEYENTVAVKANFNGCDLTASLFRASKEITNQQSRSSKSAFGRVGEITVWTRQLFRSCKVTDCDFSGACLIDCDLKSIDLRQSVFLRTNVQRAQMQGCNVGGVDLSSSNLIDTDLTGCILSDTTRFPEGYAVPKGAKNSDAQQRQMDKHLASEHNTIRGTIVVVAVVFVVFMLLFALN